MDQGACLGIPGITAHRAVRIAGPVKGRTVLVQGAAGAVGICAVQLARQAGAFVIGVVRSSVAEVTAGKAGAHEVLRDGPQLAARVKALAPHGIDHIVEVAFDDNIDLDVGVLKVGDRLPPMRRIANDPTFPSGPWFSRMLGSSSWAATTSL
jgi:NADPH2:quinone reductase